MRKKNNFSVLRIISSFLLIGSLVVAICLVYVWERNQELKIGYRINLLNKNINLVEHQINRIIPRIEKLKSPDKILLRIPSDLKLTSSNKIVHLRKVAKRDDKKEIYSNQKLNFIDHFIASGLADKKNHSDFVYVKNEE